MPAIATLGDSFDGTTLDPRWVPFNSGQSSPTLSAVVSGGAVSWTNGTSSNFGSGILSTDTWDLPNSSYTVQFSRSTLGVGGGLVVFDPVSATMLLEMYVDTFTSAWGVYAVWRTAAASTTSFGIGTMPTNSTHMRVVFGTSGAATAQVQGSTNGTTWSNVGSPLSLWSTAFNRPQRAGLLYGFDGTAGTFSVQQINDGTPAPATPPSALALAFPGGVEPRVDLMYGTTTTGQTVNVGQWENITDYVLAREGRSSIQVNRGRSSEDSGVSASTANFSLKNADGRFSPRNPTSPLYGLIGRNTPIRVGVGRPPLGRARRSGTDSTSLTAQAVTAERTGLLICAWAATPAGDITVPAEFTAQPEIDATGFTFRSGYKPSVVAGSTAAQTATFSVTATGQATATVHVPSATFVASYSATGVSGADAAVVPTINSGEFVVIVCVWSSDDENRMQPPKLSGDPGAGVYLICDSGSSADTTIPRIQVWGWNPTTTSPTISLAGVRDSTGTAAIRAYTMTGSQFYAPRFVGEVSEWPVEWNENGADVWTTVTASGVTRRLASAQQSALRSAVYQAFTSRPASLAYWPMEETDGTSFGNAVAGGFSAEFVSTPSLAAYEGFGGSDAVPTFFSAGVRGRVRSYSSTGVVSVGGLVHLTALGTTADANLVSAQFAGGDIDDVVIEYVDATTVRRKVTFTDGTADDENLLATLTTQHDRNFCWFFTVTQVGADVNVNVAYLDFTDAADPVLLSYSGETFTGKTMGIVARAAMGVEGNGTAIHTGSPAFGHLFVAQLAQNRVFNTQDDLGATSQRSLAGFVNESVHDRIRRLCTLIGVPSGVPHLGTSEAMGAQRPGTPVDLLVEAETADAGGNLFEATGYAGYNYRTRESKEARINTPRLTFDYAAGTLEPPLMPVDDDRYVANDVTVQRIGGASARAVLTSGALSVQPVPDGVGKYERTVDVSLFNDARCADQANWRMRLGTVDEARWPSLSWSLGAPANVSKIQTMPYLDVGDVVRVTNLPAWAPPGPLDLICEGYTESIGWAEWAFEANFSSATGWNVGRYSATTTRYSPDNSTLAANATSTATTISAAFTGAGWGTTDLPYGIEIAGEEMTVTAVTGTTSPQTLTVTRSVNGVVKAQVAGAVIELARPAYYGL